jgi:hypothetical protein
MSISSFMLQHRWIAPLAACSFAGAAAVVGGACLVSTPPPAPRVLHTGNYVLAAPDNHAPPGITTDSAGRRLRVIADTLAMDTLSLTYTERGTVAITPSGASEQPPVSFSITRQRYTAPTPSTFVLPSTLFGGMISGIVLSTTSLQLQMPDRTVWRYDFH